MTKPQWEQELEEFGQLHNDECGVYADENYPEECDCDMQGLKPYVRSLRTLTAEETLDNAEKDLRQGTSAWAKVLRAYIAEETRKKCLEALPEIDIPYAKRDEIDVARDVGRQEYREEAHKAITNLDLGV